MAKSKKSAKRPATKRKPAAKPRAKSRKREPVRLTSDERLTRLKPGDSLNEFLDEVKTAWALVKNKVRLSDVTLASLDRLQRNAAKATKRENDELAKQQAKLAPLTDARIIANDAAYRTGLKIKRVADAVGQTDPAVAEAFATISDRFKNAPTGAAEDPTTKS